MRRRAGPADRPGSTGQPTPMSQHVLAQRHRCVTTVFFVLEAPPGGYTAICGRYGRLLNVLRYLWSRLRRFIAKVMSLKQSRKVRAYVLAV